MQAPLGGFLVAALLSLARLVAGAFLLAALLFVASAALAALAPAGTRAIE